MLLTAFIATNVVWMVLFFGLLIWFNRELEKMLTEARKTEVHVEEVLRVCKEVSDENEELKKALDKSIELISQGTDALEKMLARDQDWQEFVKQLTGKVPQA